MTTHLGLRVCGALAWLAATAGCSVIAVQGPPKSQKPRVDVACTVDGYAPALDLAAAAGGVLDALSRDPFVENKAVYLLGSAAYLASGVYGLYTTGKCTKAKNAAYAYHATLLRPESESGESTTPNPPAAPFRPRPPEEPSVRMAPPSAPQPQQHDDEQ